MTGVNEELPTDDIHAQALRLEYKIQIDGVSDPKVLLEKRQQIG